MVAEDRGRVEVFRDPENRCIVVQIRWDYGRRRLSQVINLDLVEDSRPEMLENLIATAVEAMWRRKEADDDARRVQQQTEEAAREAARRRRAEDEWNRMLSSASMSSCSSVCLIRPETPDFQFGRESLALTSYPLLDLERALTLAATGQIVTYMGKPLRGKVLRALLKEDRAKFKAECNAQQLLREIIGFEQWQMYRKTNRVAILGDHNWIIGNIFNSYVKLNPLQSKPDVIRVDGKAKKGYNVTSFCVIARSQERIPYTDKVLAFASHCVDDPKAFYKTINRTQEHTWKEIPESAIFYNGGR